MSDKNLVIIKKGNIFHNIIESGYGYINGMLENYYYCGIGKSVIFLSHVANRDITCKDVDITHTKCNMENIDLTLLSPSQLLVQYSNLMVFVTISMIMISNRFKNGCVYIDKKTSEIDVINYTTDDCGLISEQLNGCSIGRKHPNTFTEYEIIMLKNIENIIVNMRSIFFNQEKYIKNFAKLKRPRARYHIVKYEKGSITLDGAVVIDDILTIDGSLS